MTGFFSPPLRIVVLKGILTLLLVMLLLPAFPTFSATADLGQSVQPIQIPNPASDLWREVRQRDAAMTGSTQALGVDGGILINPNGEKWRQFRMQQLLPYGGYALGAVVLILLLFYTLRGRVPIKEGVSDKKLFRYNIYERMIHWFMAFIFLFQAFTGLILLFGRSFLLPLMGPELFSLLASASKEGHNLFGPLFALALVLIFFRFVGRNIYQKGDLTWLLRGGGVIGRKHVPSNFFNMGEKTLFWLLVFVGGAIAASGLILLFPIFGQGREVMELSHVAHGIGALLMIGVIIGHIYIGTIGMEGAIEGMKSGYCDLNWAREHHDWWAQKCEQRGEALANDQMISAQGADALGTTSVHMTGEAGK
jgi:formate dehydrogenase subunit gamma